MFRHSKYLLIFTVLGDINLLSSCTPLPERGCFTDYHEVCVGQTPKKGNTWSKPNERPKQGTRPGGPAPNQYPSVYPSTINLRASSSPAASGQMARPGAAGKATKAPVTSTGTTVPTGENQKPPYLPNVPGSTDCYPPGPSIYSRNQNNLSNPWRTPSGPIRSQNCWQRVAPQSWSWRPLQEK